MTLPLAPDVKLGDLAAAMTAETVPSLLSDLRELRRRSALAHGALPPVVLTIPIARQQLSGFSPDIPVQGFHRPVVSTQATANWPGVAGMRTILRNALFILTPIVAQPTVELQISDSVLGLLFSAMVNAPAAGVPLVVPVVGPVFSSIGGTLTVQFGAAPAATNWEAVYFNGYQLTP